MNALSTELLERIVLFLTDVDDVASLSATSRLFRGAPSVPSPIEGALRVRMRARGHERAAVSALRGAQRPTCTLIGIERVWRGARAHQCVLAAGEYTSAFVDASGELYTCGGEEEEGGTEEPEEWEEMVMAHPALGHGAYADDPAEYTPRRVAALTGVRITAVSALYDHMLALSDAGAVYACGRDMFGSGALGLGRLDEAMRTPVRITALADEHVVCVAAGERHSLALTAAGRVYSWGWGSFGALGHGDEKDQLTPKRVEALKRTPIAGIAAGSTHSLVLSIAGDVYSFGQAGGTFLGHGDTGAHWMPKRIEALAAVRAVHVSAGEFYSLVVDAAGGVHSFGFGGTGALGHNDVLDQPTPKRISVQDGVRIVRAFAGPGVSLLLDADGGVHTCGRGVTGVLGLGDTTSTRVPTHVAALSGERVVSAALNHSLHTYGTSSRALVVTADGHAYAWGAISAALGLGEDALHDGVAPPANGETRYVSVPRRVHYTF